MSIHVIEGDLLESDCNVIAHQANCFNIMGAGIALQIKRRYPEALLADSNYGTPNERLGKASFSFNQSEKRLIFNLYGQFFFHNNGLCTDYAALQEALSCMFETLHLNKEHTLRDKPIKVGIPYGIGCGLAGGDWNTVSKILKFVSDKHKTDIYLYKLV